MIVGWPPEKEESVELIPLEYQGRWSINPESCGRATHQTEDWMYVAEGAIGRFEHIYQLESLELDSEGLRFKTARGGPTGELQLIDGGSMRVRFANGPFETVTLCSKDIDD